MNIIIEKLFDKLSDGIIIFASDRSVRFVNRTAKNYISSFTHNDIDNLISPNIFAELEARKLSLPVNISINSSLGLKSEIPVILMNSPVKDEYIIVIKNLENQSDKVNSLDNMRILLENNCRDRLEHLSVLFESVVSGFKAVDYSFPEFAGAAKESIKQGLWLINIFNQFIDWIDIEKNERILGSERLLISELIQLSILEMRELSQQHHVSLSVDFQEFENSFMHGNRKWIIRSISKLLRYSILNSAEFSNLHVELNKNRTSLQINISNSEFTIGMSHRTLLSKRGIISDENEHISMELLQSKLISEAYNGSLKFIESDSEQFFRLQFPTVAPNISSHETTQKQCEILAKDISILLKNNLSLNINSKELFK